MVAGPVGGYGYGRGYYRPIWAPAYVSFFGFGGGVGVGVGFGSFGWLPIGAVRLVPSVYGGRYGGRFNQVNITTFTTSTPRRWLPWERPLYEAAAGSIPTCGWSGLILTFGSGFGGVGRALRKRAVAARGIDPGAFREGKLMTGNLPWCRRGESECVQSCGLSGGFPECAATTLFGTNRPALHRSPLTGSFRSPTIIRRDGHFTPVRSGEAAGGRNVPTSVQAGTNPTIRGVRIRTCRDAVLEPGAEKSDSGARIFADTGSTTNQPSRSANAPGANNRGGIASPVRRGASGESRRSDGFS